MQLKTKKSLFLDLSTLTFFLALIVCQLKVKQKMQTMTLLKLSVVKELTNALLQDVFRSSMYQWLGQSVMIMRVIAMLNF